MCESSSIFCFFLSFCLFPPSHNAPPPRGEKSQIEFCPALLSRRESYYRSPKTNSIDRSFVFLFFFFLFVIPKLVVGERELALFPSFFLSLYLGLVLKSQRQGNPFYFSSHAKKRLSRLRPVVPASHLITLLINFEVWFDNSDDGQFPRLFSRRFYKHPPLCSPRIDLYPSRVACYLSSLSLPYLNRAKLKC